MQAQSAEVASSSSVSLLSCRCCSALKTKQANSLNMTESRFNYRLTPVVPQYCTLTPADFFPRLGKLLRINDQDGGLLAELLQDVLAQIITHQISIPDRLREQALHAMRSGLSGMLGQVPAIFALATTQQALQVRQNTPTRFWSDKARGNSRMQLSEQLCPVRNVSRGRLGSGKGDMLRLLHELLLSVEASAVGIHTDRVPHLKVKFVTCFSAGLKKAIAQFIKCNCSVSASVIVLRG
jgi:hypothetical protein